MKKNLWSFLAIILAISASVLQSYSSKPKHDEQSGLINYNWYPVNSSDQISSTTATYSNTSKAGAITANVCKDQVAPNCLYGTNGSVTVGQDISGEPAAQRIMKKL